MVTSMIYDHYKGHMGRCQKVPKLQPPKKLLLNLDLLVQISSPNIADFILKNKKTAQGHMKVTATIRAKKLENLKTLAFFTVE